MKTGRRLRGFRLGYPEDERRLDYLPMLFDAYAIVDEAVSASIEKEEKKRRAFACGKGCGNCCRSQTDIPVYPLEVKGISWFLAEKMPQALKDAVKGNISEGGRACPFLADDACSIHPVRPVSCRQFNVFGAPCKEGEDPFYSRRADVLDPPVKDILRAFIRMLPFYGITEKQLKNEAAANYIIHTEARNLREIDWP